jgi:hypothetical protein
MEERQRGLMRQCLALIGKRKATPKSRYYRKCVRDPAHHVQVYHNSGTRAVHTETVWRGNGSNCMYKFRNRDHAKNLIKSTATTREVQIVCVCKVVRSRGFSEIKLCEILVDSALVTALYNGRAKRH